ncbi:MAG: hypothetical protein ABJF04_01595 [Reichenbachiella sp.]|uniref:hypothetical protein n=1 Tax=Reichenbachiella sp. TaxID=2184521 RepID=UPI003264510A
MNKNNELSYAGIAVLACAILYTILYLYSFDSGQVITASLANQLMEKNGSLYGLAFFISLISIFPIKQNAKFLLASFVFTISLSISIVVYNHLTPNPFGEIHLEVAVALTFHSFIALILHYSSLEKYNEICEVFVMSRLERTSTIDVIFTFSHLVVLIAFITN